MKQVKTIQEMRAARSGLSAPGFVPTMGFLHEGHLSLIRRARAECGSVVVSIFVNPTQFGVNEDLSRYPRDAAHDLALLADVEADVVFMPTAEEIYPQGFATSIDVGPVAEPLEGAVRPGHFSGVATVVTKLLNIVQPERAYFGQKDAQQCAVIRRVVADLNIPVEVVIGDTVRNPDGLALSSRNSYLTDEERRRATALSRALARARQMVEGGERQASVLKDAMRDILSSEEGFSVDYISVADPVALNEVERVGAEVLISMAVRVGTVRLIDNALIRVS